MDIVTIVAWLVIGAVAGWAAGEVMRGRGFGLLGNIVVGILGAFLGGILFNLLGVSTAGFPYGSLITAFLGSVILLALIGAVRRTDLA